MHRKLSAIVALLLGIITMLVLGVGLAHAQSINGGGNLSVPKSKTIDGSYFAGGRSIDIGGTVNGDVICGTQTLDISGTVHGDVVCGAQTVTITGTVDGNVRLAAQNITLSGKVTRNASIAGQSLNLGSNSAIGGDLSYVGSELTSNGTVGRDLVGAFGTATIAGTVGRNMTATVEKLTVTSDAVITGAVKYTSKDKANVASGAQVGSIQQSLPKERHHDRSGFKKWVFLFSLVSALALLFSSLILVLLTPRFFYATSEEMFAQPGWTILAGFIAAIAFPALVLLALVTVIGIPLGLLLLFVGIIISMLSYPVAGFYLGRMLFSRLLHWSDNAIVLMLLGIVVLLILLWIPFVGFLAWLLMTWVGFGSMFRAYRHRYERPVYQLDALQPAK